jgi:PAS domain S-box-containing protein
MNTSDSSTEPPACPADFHPASALDCDPGFLLLRLDGEGVIRDLNQGLAACLGQPAGQLKGTLLWPQLPAGPRAELQALARQTALDRQRRTCDACLGGRWFELAWQAGPAAAPAGLTLLGWDITERKREEEALRASEQRLALALQAAGEGLIDWDLEADRITATPLAAEQLGWPPAEFPGHRQGYLDLVHPDHWPVLQAILRNLQEGLAVQFETQARFKTPGGPWRWIQVRGQVVQRGPDGRALRCLATHEDITGRKWMVDTQQFLARLASGSLAGEEFFPALARYLGRCLEADWAFIGEVSGDGGQARALAHFRDRQPAGGLVYPLEPSPFGKRAAQAVFCWPAEAGRRFPRDPVLGEMGAGSCLGVALTDNQSRVIGVIVLAWRQPQPTLEPALATVQLAALRAAGELERQQAQEALLASESRLRVITETARDAIIMLDASGNISFWNPAAERLFGYTSAEVTGRPTDLFIMPPRHRHAHKAGWAEFQQTGQASVLNQTQELVACRRGGEEFPIELSLSAIQRQDGWHAVGIIRDASERQRLAQEREEMAAQKRLLEKAESLNRMAGAIAHHFNNQLAAVMLSLGLARPDLSRHNAPVHALEDAMKAARQAAEVSTLMLTYLGQIPSPQEPLDLALACQLSLANLQKLLPEGLRLYANFPVPGPVVEAGAKQIQQILKNLATNAWEACGGRSGAIQLAVKTVAPGEIPAAYRFPIGAQPGASHYACLEVADDGCGIPAPDMEKIFDPFFSTKFTGRGLGLPVVLGIVRARDGFATAESQPGRGSIFRIFLPLSSKKPARPPAPQASLQKPDPGGAILLAEDDTGLRLAVSSALKRLGFGVFAAQDGVEAVELFQQHQAVIRCVLSDLTMPRMDGWQTLAAVRRISPGVRVILASGYSEGQAMEGRHQELPQAFLSKPYDLEVLTTTLARVLTDQPA